MPYQLPSQSNAVHAAPLPMLRPLPQASPAHRATRRRRTLAGVLQRVVTGTMRRVLRGLAPVLSATGVLASNTACVSTNATLLDVAPSARRAPVPAEQVRIYRLASQVPGRYDELALINSEGAHGMTNEKKMLESMRRKAGELGANALILEAITEPSAGAKVAATVFGVSAERKGKAVAIYVHADSARPM